MRSASDGPPLRNPSARVTSRQVADVSDVARPLQVDTEERANREDKIEVASSVIEVDAGGRDARTVVGWRRVHAVGWRKRPPGTTAPGEAGIAQGIVYVGTHDVEDRARMALPRTERRL